MGALTRNPELLASPVIEDHTEEIDT